MPLTQCPDCNHEISTRARSCPHCGCPAAEDSGGDKDKGIWKAVTRSRTPINIFALAMMAAASIFGASATQIAGHELEAFTYALHIFLAVAGMFFVCLLFCRSSIYHPEDLTKAKRDGFEYGPDRPILAASLIGLMILGYSLYQAFA